MGHTHLCRTALRMNVLILGGYGFIGRSLVEAFASSDFKKIRVADKVMPALANLSESQKAVFESDVVDYKQANLANPASIEKVFAKDFGEWDLVVNCAAETKYSQAEQVYKENVVDLATKCATEAAKVGVKKKPWTKLAEAKLADTANEQLAA